MRILITNDDGFSAFGLQALAKRLVKQAEVYIVAPSSEQSGVGHGITAHIPLRCQKIDLSWFSGLAWSVDGTPADCVKIAMEKLIPAKPDILISGINHGANLGTDTIYSGTVAGAMEGYLYGLPAMAVSVTGVRRGNGVGNFEYAADKASEICLKWQQCGFLPRTLLNVNIPGECPEDIKGSRITRLGWRWYKDAYDERIDPHGRTYYWLQGQPYCRDENGETDVEACRDGYISITPLCNDLTDYKSLDRLDMF